MKSIRQVNSFNELKESELQNFNEPILVKNGCKPMSAIEKWNLKYLKEKFGNVILPVEKYSSLDNMNKLNKKDLKMKFSNYLDKIDGDKLYYCAEVPLENYYDKIDCDIFDDLEYDFDDIREPDSHLLFLGKNKNSGCHLHIGDDFLLNQIIGKKNVYMFDYNDNPELKMNSFYNEKPNFIKKNFFSLDKKQLNLYKVELEPGDSLLIPPWWWHATEGIGLSCSVTKTYERTDNTILFNYPYLYFLNAIEMLYEYIHHNSIYIMIVLLMLIIILLYSIIISNDNINNYSNEIVLYDK